MKFTIYLITCSLTQLSQSKLLFKIRHSITKRPIIRYASLSLYISIRASTMQNEIKGSEQQKVGITEYLHPGPQIPAITKYLLTDFLVNQLDKQQQLVTLKRRPNLTPQLENALPLSFELSPQMRQEILSILGEKLLGQIERLYAQLECGERVTVWEFVVEKELDKVQRKRLHDFVREKLHFIESITHQGEIRVKYNKNIRKMNPNARQKYTHFVLYKHGIDTFNAIFRLSRATHVSEKLFSTAGLKDKRGHTTQRVSVYNTDAPTLAKFYKEAYRNRQMWIDQIEDCKEEKVEVGGLSGNQFGLVLRLINASDGPEAIRRVESFKLHGMINYFGLQRFGQFSTKTYQLGAMFVRREFQKLVQAIILSDCNNFEANRLKKQIYETKKYFRAEKALQNKYKIQKLVFRGLNKYGQNYQNVFQAMPRSIKTLYVHSLQSYLWNRLASRRLKEQGIHLREGDIVGRPLQKQPLLDPQQHEEDNQPLQLSEQAVEQALETELITKDNISKYGIYDLVLPLFGPMTVLQEGSWLQQTLREELSSLELTQQDFSHLNKLQNSQAAWRRMLAKPEIIDYELIQHGSAKEDLQNPFYTLGEKLEHSAGDLSAIRVVVRLPKSSYATMAIREMLHVPSEFDVQRELNSLYEARYCK